MYGSNQLRSNRFSIIFDRADGSGMTRNMPTADDLSEQAARDDSDHHGP